MAWPLDVGILAIEMYFPHLYVDQTELETLDGASAGKYTVGLGQKAMGYCSDVEDINSLCLTVLKRLLERRSSSLDARKIGRLEVGTETTVDKSKSVKSVIMQIFEEYGNTDVEGVDTINACFGGTQALFNAINWIESSSWDGRLAVVVMADIAVYASGPARCTGGAGAIALLIGPNAPLVFDRGLRALHMCHNYDFYKPNPSSSYPVVDGKLSIECYLNALDKCFALYRKKATEKCRIDPLLESFTGVLFHTPYCKLVQKSLARLKYLELNSRPELFSNNIEIEEIRYLPKNTDGVVPGEPFDDKSVEKLFLDFSRPFYESVTKPSLYLAENIGNMYTPSLYACLVSLLINKPLSKLAGQSVLLFSYGSGSCAAMFSLQITPDSSPMSPLAKLVESLQDIRTRLESRSKQSPQEFVKTLTDREEAYGKAPYIPNHGVDELFPGTYYLKEIDGKFRRIYGRTPPNQPKNALDHHNDRSNSSGQMNFF